MAIAGSNGLAQAQTILSGLKEGQSAQRGVVAHLAGRWAVAAGDPRKADELFRLALEELPTLRPAIRGIQRVILQGGDAKRVLEWLDLQIRATSHPREAASLYRERGRLVESIFGDFQATRQCHEAALLAAPTDLSVLFSLYHIQSRIGNLDTTAQTLQKIADNIEDDGFRAVLEHSCALIGLAANAPHHEILERLSWANRYAPSNPVVSHDGFRVAQGLGTDADALAFLYSEIELRRQQGNQGPAMWRAAKILERCDHPQDALALLEEATLAQPHRLHLSQQYYYAALKHSSPDQAVQAAMARVRTLQNAEAPWQASAWYDLAERLLARDRYDETALACLRKSIAKDPGNRVASFRYLATLREQEKYAEFIAQSKLWCELVDTRANGKERAYWLEEAAGVCARELKNLPVARKLLRAARRLDPASPSILAALERIYLAEDDAAPLRALYRQQIEDNEDPDRDILLRTLLCHVVTETHNPKQALADAMELLERKPDCQSTLGQVARLLSASGQHTQLLEITLREAELCETPRKQAQLIAQAGDVARRLSQSEKAAGYYRRALELDESHDGARRSLEALARQRANRSELLHQLQAQLEQSPRAPGLRIEVAELLLETGAHAHEALKVLAPLVQSTTRSFSALRVGENILNSLGDHRACLELMDRRIAMMEGAESRAFWLLRSAWTRWRHLSDHASAIEDLWTATQLAPKLHVARWMLFELLADQGSTRLWPWLRAQLQDTTLGPSIMPLVTRWLVRNPPAEQVVQWLSLDQHRRADGPSQCLDWLSPARRCGNYQLGAAILNRFIQDRPPRPDDPRRMQLHYLSARAQVLCREWNSAQQSLVELADWELGHYKTPGSLLGRVDAISAGSPLQGAIGRLKVQRTEQRSRASRLHANLWIVDLLAQAGQWKEAIRRCEQLLSTTPKFLPAHYLYIYCLEHDTANLDPERIAAAYLALAQRHSQRALKAKALRSAGQRYCKLAQKTPKHTAAAWSHCKAAFEIEPDNDQGFENIWECATRLQACSASDSLLDAAQERLGLLRGRGASNEEYISLGYLAERIFSVGACVELTQSLVQAKPSLAALHLLAARSLARSQQWAQAANCVQRALDHEGSKKRQGALHFFLAELLNQAGDSSAAIIHFMQAAMLGVRVDQAGQLASQLAEKDKKYDQQVAALELLVDRGSRHDRPRYMRELADLYRGPLQQIDRAIDLIARLVASSPDDQDAVALLYQLLRNANRNEEALVTLRVATTRLQTKLRSRVAGAGSEQLPISAVNGLMKFFELENETDGVYLATAVIEIAAPQTLRGPGCDVLRSEPWPLPSSESTGIISSILREIPSAFAIRRMVDLWPHLPVLPELGRELPSGGKTLSPDRDANRVIHTLGALLGFKEIHVAVDLNQEDRVLARWSLQGQPTLILGRKIYTAPIAPRSRDAIGRALWRLASGGDCFRELLCERQRRTIALLPDLIEGRIHIENDDEAWIDPDYARACMAVIPKDLEHSPLSDVRERSRTATLRSILPLDASLEAAEDRFGAICTADPRISLALRAKHSEERPELYCDLVAYLLSNGHIELRRELGYQHLVELDMQDLEVLPL